MKLIFTILLGLIAINLNAQILENLLGAWQGVDVYQDENSYDGKTFYLPNEETVVFEEKKMKTYYYPYSKIDEFTITYDYGKIRYKMKSGYTEAKYLVYGDTLKLEMHFINKIFMKVYKRIDVDQETITELDRYGFNPSSVQHEMELDTFHLDQVYGFDHYDSLKFTPYRYIQFVGDDKIKVNREKELNITRGYNSITFRYKGVDHQFTVNHSEGTQTIHIEPNSICRCDNIILPYIAVSWADRIRKKIKEDLEWD